MVRVLFMLILIAVGFGGGFFAGYEYHRNEIREDPAVFLKEYGKDFKDTADEKFNKIKKILLD